MVGKCAKLQTIAVVQAPDGSLFGGSNWCDNPQEKCPRGDMPTGVGYELCKDVCHQRHHAEVEACIKAGDKCKGATLYLIGHTYCCDNCKAVMKMCGIAKIVILKDMSSGYHDVDEFYKK